MFAARTGADGAGRSGPATLTRAERIPWDSAQLREALNRPIIDLAGQGVPIKAIARTTGVSRNTIRKILRVTIRCDPLVVTGLSAQDVLKFAHKDALKDSHDASDGVDGGEAPPGLVG